MFQILGKYFKGDKVIWAVILALSLISLLSVYSSTGSLAYRNQEGNTFYYLLRHGFFLLSGLVIIIITHHIPYKYFSRLSQFLLILSIPLLLLTLVLGKSLNQAARWVEVPGLGFTIQSSDFAKLALIMYVARVLSQKQDKVDDFKGTFLPVIAPVILVCLLILPANFSTAAIVFFTCLVLLFIGRIKFRYLLLLILSGVLVFGLFLGAAMLTKHEGRLMTWKNRIENYINGKSNSNYQVEQAKIAIVNGGIFGTGPGNNRQRNSLPHSYSDFIYAIIIEDYGLIGGIVVIALYLYLLFRAGVIVRKAERTFPAFVAIGLTINLVFQAMINMGVAVNIFPVTGQTLPLVSMGGTSVLFTCIALGVILSVSRTLYETEAEIHQVTESTENAEQTQHNN